MIPYHQIARRFYNQPLLLTPQAARTVSGFLFSRIGQVTLNEPPPAVIHSPRVSEFVGEDARGPDGDHLPYRMTRGGVAIITIVGELVNRGAWVGASSGLVSYEGIKHQLAMAEQDPAVAAVLLDIESPGGEAIGCFDAAAAVRRCAAVKPVIAMINGMAASGGYALASGATRRISIPDGLAGSIGVVMAHFDFSAYLEQEGIKPTLIFAGARKADGNPFEPLPEAVRDRFKAEVDHIYAMFVACVAEGTGLSAEAIRATEAEMLLGAEAVNAGLVDELSTFTDVVALAESSEFQTVARAARSVSVRAPERSTLGALKALANEGSEEEDMKCTTCGAEGCACGEGCTAKGCGCCEACVAAGENSEQVGASRIEDGSECPTCGAEGCACGEGCTDKGCKCCEACAATTTQSSEGGENAQAKSLLATLRTFFGGSPATATSAPAIAAENAKLRAQLALERRQRVAVEVSSVLTRNAQKLGRDSRVQAEALLRSALTDPVACAKTLGATLPALLDSLPLAVEGKRIARSGNPDADAAAAMDRASSTVVGEEEAGETADLDRRVRAHMKSNGIAYSTENYAKALQVVMAQ